MAKNHIIFITVCLAVSLLIFGNCSALIFPGEYEICHDFMKLNLPSKNPNLKYSCAVTLYVGNTGSKTQEQIKASFNTGIRVIIWSYSTREIYATNMKHAKPEVEFMDEKNNQHFLVRNLEPNMMAELRILCVQENNENPDDFRIDFDCRGRKLHINPSDSEFFRSLFRIFTIFI